MKTKVITILIVSLAITTLLSGCSFNLNKKAQSSNATQTSTSKTTDNKAANISDSKNTGVALDKDTQKALDNAKDFSSKIKYIKGPTEYKGNVFAFTLPEKWTMWEDPDNNGKHIIINSDDHYRTYNLMWSEGGKYDTIQKAVGVYYSNVDKTVDNYKKISDSYSKLSDGTPIYKLAYSWTYEKDTFITYEIFAQTKGGTSTMEFIMPEANFKTEQAKIDKFIGSLSIKE